MACPAAWLSLDNDANAFSMLMIGLYCYTLRNGHTLALKML